MKETYSQECGMMRVTNIANWPESTCFSMLKIQEYLRKELHKLI